MKNNDIKILYMVTVTYCSIQDQNLHTDVCLRDH